MACCRPAIKEQAVCFPLAFVILLPLKIGFMKKLFATLAFLCLITLAAKSQYLFNAGVDAYRTDNRRPVEFVDKAQFGLEFNYFLLTQLSFTAGVEIYTDGGSSFVPGARFYPIEPVFLRFRPMIGRNVDYSFGVGYGRKITDLWRLEVMTDYYFEYSNVAIRFGVGYQL